MSHICWNDSCSTNNCRILWYRALFIKNYPPFIKNYRWPLQKKLQPLISHFIKNSIFGKNRDPWFPWRENLYNHAFFTLELLGSFADLADAVDFNWSAARTLKKKLIVSVSIQSIKKQNINLIQIRWGMINIIASIHFCFNYKVIFITSPWPLVESAALWLCSGCASADAWFER